MIDNSDKVGHFQVTMIASKNCVASFQCPTMDDVYIEVNRIKTERASNGLPTAKATAREITHKSRGSVTLGDEINVNAVY